MLGRFQVGYCNGTLLNVLSQRSGEIMEGLKTLGVLKADGREHFHGCVTVPIFDEPETSAASTARRVTDGEPPTPVSARPASRRVERRQRQDQSNAFHHRGDFGRRWRCGRPGFKNVIALYGTQGWTARPREAFARAQHDRKCSCAWTTTRPGGTAPNG